MNVLREQDRILQNYHGSMKNRKNMIDKFSNILGSIDRKQSKNKWEYILLPFFNYGSSFILLLNAL